MLLFDSCFPASKKRKEGVDTRNHKPAKPPCSGTEFPWALGYLVTHNQIPGFVGLFWRQKLRWSSSRCSSSRCSSSPSGFVSLLFINTSPLCSLFPRPPRFIQTPGLPRIRTTGLNPDIRAHASSSPTVNPNKVGITEHV